MWETVDVLVEKVSEGLVTEMNKEEKIEKREELHSEELLTVLGDSSEFMLFLLSLKIISH